MRKLAAAAGISALVGAGWVVGCGSDVEPAGPTGGSPPTGGAGGTAGAGGQAGAADRGDPSEFPTTCAADCETACAQLESCGGSSSPGFPLVTEDCIARCAFAEGGSGHPDLSGNFKCCTSQTDCADVAQCGGWLAHPDAVASCARYCECRQLGGAAAALTAGHLPPEGYAFAPDALMIDPGAASLDLSRVEGAEVLVDGRRKLVRLGSSATTKTIAELARIGRVLPTFVDPAGRTSAATGDLVLIVEQGGALAPALRVAERFGLGRERQLKTRLAGEPSSRLYVLRGTDAWQSLDALVELGAMPGIRAELDQVRRYEKRYTPTDPDYVNQWHLANAGQNGSTPSVDGRVSEAWDITLGDPQVIIAINDDGVDLHHPEFADKLEPELNYPSTWEADMAAGTFAGHGTSVTGVAAAKAGNDVGGAGVCPGCGILPHLLGPITDGGFQLTDAEVAQGFEDMVDAGAWVINNSWGYETGDPVLAFSSTAVPGLASVVAASFEYAETNGRGGLGTVIVFAAGNSNDVLDPMTAYSKVVSVAAVDDLGLKAYYSSFGPENDIAAPSSGGLNGITTTAAGSQYTPDFGGTSSASPFVAGVVGLVLSAAPTRSAEEVREILAGTATRIDRVFGVWDHHDQSVFYGAGLVNAYAAVKLAKGDCTSLADCAAPSDECGAQCGTHTQCDVCRTHADCAPGHACQALPSLGLLVCVAAKTSNDCPAGTTEARGYCLPSPATCGLCTSPSAEVCNGRDDDCNGAVDDGNVCQGAPRCFMDAPGCGTGMVCAGTQCATACSDATGCPNQTCARIKDQYGAARGYWACVSSYGGSGACVMRCEVRASTLEDAGLADFVGCMEDGAADCSVINTCRELLPMAP
jgi:hypothetical protein